jgi:hypothetical protein
MHGEGRRQLVQELQPHGLSHGGIGTGCAVGQFDQRYF